MWLDWTIENLKFTEGIKTLILTVLGGSWTVQPLRYFEPFEVMLGKTFEEYGRENFGVQHIHIVAWTGFSASSLFISAMALEQTVKDLQTQHAQFQQMIMALAKG